MGKREGEGEEARKEKWGDGKVVIITWWLWGMTKSEGERERTG